MSIFQRLKQERERLEMSQPVLGTLTSVGKTTVINWEKGVSAPDAVQLSVMAANGFDVLYIVTGQRSSALPPSASLAPGQRAILNSYDLCVPEAQLQLQQLAAMLAAGLQTSAGKEATAARNEIVHVTSKGGFLKSTVGKKTTINQK